MLRSTFCSANRRTARSLAVNAPSLKMGCPNRFVVAIDTTRPLVSSASRNRPISLSRTVSSLPNGIRSSSWKLTPYAPSSASRCTDSTGSSAARDAEPKTSWACQPTVQSPKENRSAGVGA